MGRQEAGKGHAAVRRHVARGRPANTERAGDITRIAFRQIATLGFEGLRVRKIAAEAGISHATLLHYFPTKKSLVQGVVRSIFDSFRGAAQGPLWKAVAPRTAIEELRGEFADLEWRMDHTPELFVVLTELDMHARRDPEVNAILSRLYGTWRTHLASLFKKGIRSGELRTDLDPKSAALATMVQIKAMGYHVADSQGRRDGHMLVAVLAQQVENWVRVRPAGRGPSATKGSRAR
jgi:AcrR family transcriptional regulator